MQIISRAEAKHLKLKRYFTGKPCKHGHIAERQTCNGECMSCVSIRNKKSTERRRQWHVENLDEIKRKKKLHREKNKESIRLKKKIDGQTNKEVNRIKSKLYYEKNKTVILARVKRYRIDNPEKMAIRDLLKRVISNWNGGREKCEKILGYTYQELRDHLESMFEQGMSWDNHGEWHIDHVIPVSVLIEYGFTDPAFINGLDNLQPLWAIDNRRKGNRM